MPKEDGKVKWYLRPISKSKEGLGSALDTGQKKKKPWGLGVTHFIIKTGRE